MKILLIGATGGTGRHVLTQAAERGDEVVAYVRSPHKLADLASDRLRIVPGGLDDVPRMAEAMAGADAVIVTLGPPVSLPTALRCTLMRETLPHVAEAMGRAGLRRLVVLSAWGAARVPRIATLRGLIYRPFLRQALIDHSRAEEPLRDRFDLTTVHPGFLTDSADDGRAGRVNVAPLQEIHHRLGNPDVSRAAVARVMLDAAHDPGTIGDSLVIWT